MIKLSFIDKHLVKREREQRKKRGDDFFCSRALVTRFERGCEAVENEQSDKREKREPYTFEGWSFWRASSREHSYAPPPRRASPPLDVTLQMHIICIIIRSTFHAVVKAATLPRMVDETRERGRPDYQLR